jgi:hypothetical protein
MIKAICLLVSLIACSVSASVITLDSIDNGWYTQTGEHVLTNTNTWTGTDGSGTYRNSFYNFNVSVLSGKTITSVVLTFLSNNGFYASTDSFETLQIWDVNTTPGFSSSVAVYNDLMSGVKYGQINVACSSGLRMQQINISLDSLSFNDILADSFFSVGAHLSSLTSGYNQVLWSASSMVPAARLTVEYNTMSVPTPSTLALLVLVLGLVGVSVSKKRNLRN